MGKYNLKLVAKDEAGNKSSVDFVLNIYEKASLEIDKTNISLNIGETLLVSAKVKGKDQTVNWTSDNNTIVVVDNGKITAVAPGTANIRVTCGNLAKEINASLYVAIETPEKYLLYCEGLVTLLPPVPPLELLFALFVV